MIKIFDVESARQTILRRKPLALVEVPPEVLKRTESTFGAGITPAQAVNRIIDSVLEKGDLALRHWSRLLDEYEQGDFIVPADEMERAYHSLPGEIRSAMRTSMERIRSFHELQPLPAWETTTLGGSLGQRITPIEIVGVYVPGGSAPLPSSLLMSVIPAQVAGVGRVIVCTPPNPHTSILAAAHLCNIDSVFQLGGAQAIAALALGTQSVPKVDKIVGAGNLFVTLAKQQLYGTVGIDGLAGPTETMVIADHTARPAWVAADILAQAEHDVLASSILLTPDTRLAEAVQLEIARQMEDLSRTDVISRSLSSQSGIVLTPDLESAARLANEYAPEHLCLSVAQPRLLVERIYNAGGLFLGEGSFEVLGDYVAGPSHVMPTGGTARFASPLNVLDFVKISSVIALDEGTTQKLAPVAAQVARLEGLTAHAAAADFRLRG